MIRRLYHSFRREDDASARMAKVGVVALLLSALTLASLGCCARLRELQARRLIQKDSPTIQEEELRASTELVLNIDDDVENITLSPDSKRLILETALHSNDSQPLVLARPSSAQIGVEVWNIEFADARPEAIAPQSPYLVADATGAAAFDKEGGRLFWLDSKTAPVLAQHDLLDSAVVRGASVGVDDAPIFYATPSRLYASSPRTQTPQQPEEESASLPEALPAPFPDVESSLADASEQTAPPAEDAVVPPAPPAIASLAPLRALESEIKTEEEPPKSAAASEDVAGDRPISEGADSTSEDSTPEIGGTDSKDVSDRKVFVAQKPFGGAPNGQTNVLFVKKLNDDLFSLAREPEEETKNGAVQRVKIAQEVKDAASTRISPQAKWLICYNPTPEYALRPLADEKAENADKSKSETKENEETTKEESTKTEVKEPVVEELRPFDENWSIALLRDRKRVARFPDKIKMTFDSSTSDQEIYGRVVDVLDVADAEDLVATLVEEIMPDDPNAQALHGDFNFNPRYKIVIWDLNVPRTVDLAKAKYPLFALEVSQIAIPYPVERKFCKFSPSGKAFAARVEPKFVTIWQSVSGRRIAELGEHEGIVRSFAFSPREMKMVVGTEGEFARLQLWEIRKGVVYRTLDDYAESAKCAQAIAISADEQYVYFANDLGQIKRWNLRASDDE